MAEPLGDFKPITRQEVPEAPEWADRYLAAINKQVKAITDLLKGGLGPRQENADQRAIDVRHGKATTVTSSKLTGRPAGAVLVSSPFPIQAFQAVPTDVREIEVTAWFQAPVPTGDVEIVIKILGE